METSVLSRYLDAETLARLANRALAPRGLVLGHLAGGHRSPLSGYAVEFASHREYVPGDDLKHLDWRVFYRREKFFIKQYAMETNLVCHLLLDVSASMRYGQGPEQKLEHAARLAVALAHTIVRRGDQVSLATFDEAVRSWIPPSNSTTQLVRMAENLAALKPEGKSRSADCLVELAERTRRREIVLIVSDCFLSLAGLEAALGRLRFKQHEVVLFQIAHGDELRFDFSGPMKFTALEGTQDVQSDPAEIRAAYLAALARFSAELEEICRRNRVERVLVDTTRNLGETLIDYLDHRARVHRAR